MGGWNERAMGQTGFFDVERRLEAISAKGDPLQTIKKIVRWEDFRADIESVTETKPEERKSNASRAVSIGAPLAIIRCQSQKSANTTLSKVRARVEHVFGQQQNSMGGKIVRTIGIVRARFKIGMMNLG